MSPVSLVMVGGVFFLVFLGAAAAVVHPEWVMRARAKVVNWRWEVTRSTREQGSHAGASADLHRELQWEFYRYSAFVGSDAEGAMERITALRALANGSAEDARWALRGAIQVVERLADQVRRETDPNVLSRRAALKLGDGVLRVLYPSVRGGLRAVVAALKTDPPTDREVIELLATLAICMRAAAIYSRRPAKLAIETEEEGRGFADFFPLRVARAAEIDECYSFWREQMHEALDRNHLRRLLQKNNRLIWVLHRSDEQRGERLVGLFSLVPLNASGLAALRAGAAVGRVMVARNIGRPGDEAACYYIGGVAAAGFQAKGATIAHLEMKCRLALDRGIPLFTRPLSEAGLRLARRRGFVPVARRDDVPQMGEILCLSPAPEGEPL